MKQNEHHQNALAVLAKDPVEPRILWVGSRRMWHTTDDGREWQAVTPELDGSAITTIEIPPAAGQVWAGTPSPGPSNLATWPGSACAGGRKSTTPLARPVIPDSLPHPHCGWFADNYPLPAHNISMSNSQSHGPFRSEEHTSELQS